MATTQRTFVRYVARSPSDAWAGVAEMSDGNAWAFGQSQAPSNLGPVAEFLRQVELGRWRYVLVGPEWSPRS